MSKTEIPKWAIQHELYATMIGYDHLARRAKKLGDKVYFRMCREETLRQLRDAGGEVDVTRDPPICTLTRVPPVEFTANDIELMRQCVADHDAKVLADIPEGNKAEPWDDERDEWSERIDAAFPTRSGSHAEYAIAQRMIGHRRSKASLIALVNWLLVENRGTPTE